MVSLIVNVSGLGEFVGVRGVNEVSYLSLILLVFGFLVIFVDFGLYIEEGGARVLAPSPLAAMRLCVGQRGVAGVTNKAAAGLPSGPEDGERR